MLKSQGEAKPYLYWKLVSAAVTHCQSLGYHRESTYRSIPYSKAESIRRLFWTVYTFDKNISLVLGRVSNMQGLDIDTQHPIPSTDLALRAWDESFIMGIRLAELQGRIFVGLYSTATMARDSFERSQLISRLAAAMEKWHFELEQVRGDLALYLPLGQLTIYRLIREESIIPRCLICPEGIGTYYFIRTLHCFFMRPQPPEGNCKSAPLVSMQPVIVYGLIWISFRNIKNPNCSQMLTISIGPFSLFCSIWNRSIHWHFQDSFAFLFHSVYCYLPSCYCRNRHDKCRPSWTSDGHFGTFPKYLSKFRTLFYDMRHFHGNCQEAGTITTDVYRDIQPTTGLTKIPGYLARHVAILPWKCPKCLWIWCYESCQSIICYRHSEWLAQWTAFSVGQIWSGLWEFSMKKVSRDIFSIRLHELDGLSWPRRMSRAILKSCRTYIASLNFLFFMQQPC